MTLMRDTDYGTPASNASETISVTIQGHAKVGLVLFDGLHQGLGVGCPHFVVDVETVG